MNKMFIIDEIDTDGNLGLLKLAKNVRDVLNKYTIVEK
jgi:hypothetical protein